MRRVTGSSIRRQSFRRSFGRGYRRDEVDGFLADVSRWVDELEDAAARAAAERGDDTGDRVEATGDEVVEASAGALLLLEQAQRVADETMAAARVRADEIIVEGEATAKRLHLKTREARDEALRQARDDAERIRQRAREQAARIVAEARESEEQASRRVAEVELRVAHAERLLSERAATLRAEADLVDGLAADLLGPHGCGRTAEGPQLRPVASTQN